MYEKRFQQRIHFYIEETNGFKEKGCETLLPR